METDLLLEPAPNVSQGVAIFPLRETRGKGPDGFGAMYSIRGALTSPAELSGTPQPRFHNKHKTTKHLLVDQ